MGLSKTPRRTGRREEGYTGDRSESGTERGRLVDGLSRKTDTRRDVWLVVKEDGERIWSPRVDPL